MARKARVEPDTTGATPLPATFAGGGAAIPLTELTPQQRALAARVLKAAAKQIEDDGAESLDEGAYCFSLTLTTGGDVIVDKAGETESVTINADDLLTAACEGVTGKTREEFLGELAREVKARRKSKGGAEQHEQGVKAMKASLKNVAKKLKCVEVKPKAGATRCEPTVTIHAAKGQAA